MSPSSSPKCYDLYFDFCFEHANAGAAVSIFGFSEYLSTLALLLVVYAISDFRYRYRLHLTRYNVRKIAFYVSVIIGGLILLIDVWFHNEWPILVNWNDSNNLKAFLGFIFLCQVFYLVRIAFLRPPVFRRSNSEAYFYTMYYTIGRGNPDQLAVVADELGPSAKNIFRLASKRASEDKRTPKEAGFAHNILLLLADKKLCRVMVDKSPWVVIELFRCATEYIGHDMPFGLFAKNAAEQLIFNENSSLHHEDSGFESGYFGYTKPVSRSVFGNFDLVEALARTFGSPLDLMWYGKREIKSSHLEAYARAGIIFLESYFGSQVKHLDSLAFSQILAAFKGAISGLHKLNGADGDFTRSNEYEKLEITVKFICDAVSLMDKHNIDHAGPIKPLERFSNGVHDQIAQLIVDVIFAASGVKEPRWTCWHVQHNAVWGKFFSFSSDSTAWKLIKFKVRRLLYDDIKEIDTLSFFQGANYLGLCLNIFGFNETRGTRNDFYPLKKVVLAWTKRNYLALLKRRPEVAEACIQGSVSFDPESNRLIKLYEGSIEKIPPREYFELDKPKDQAD